MVWQAGVSKGWNTSMCCVLSPEEAVGRLTWERLEQGGGVDWVTHTPAIALSQRLSPSLPLLAPVEGPRCLTGIREGEREGPGDPKVPLNFGLKEHALMTGTAGQKGKGRSSRQRRAVLVMAGRMAFFCVFHRTREMKLHWFLLGKLIAHRFLHKGKEASHLLSPAFLPFPVPHPSPPCPARPSSCWLSPQHSWDLVIPSHWKLGFFSSSYLKF